MSFERLCYYVAGVEEVSTMCMNHGRHPHFLCLFLANIALCSVSCMLVYSVLLLVGYSRVFLLVYVESCVRSSDFGPSECDHA